MHVQLLLSHKKRVHTRMAVQYPLSDRYVGDFELTVHNAVLTSSGAEGNRFENICRTAYTTVHEEGELRSRYFESTFFTQV